MSDTLWGLLTVDVENMNSPLMRGAYNRNLVSIEIIRPIIKICDQFNIKAVFFMSVYEHCKFDKERVREVAQYIADQGHDVQLHTHPYWCYGREHMWQYSLSEQTKIIKDGCDILFDWLGKYPIAHRAGAYGINRDTIKALHANDIYIDSSMYHEHSNCKISWSKNQLVEADGVVEIPVTGLYRQHYLMIGNRLRIKYRKNFIKTDIDWCTLDELTHYIHQAKSNSLKLMNLFMHSYSFLKFDPKLRNFSTNFKNKTNLETFLKICTQDLGVRFITIQQFWNKYKDNPELFLGNDFVPVTSVYVDLPQRLVTNLKKIFSGNGENS